MIQPHLLGLGFLETAVAGLNKLDTASQLGHEWLAQATGLYEIIELPYASCQPLVSPLAAIFRKPQSHPL